VVGHLLVWRERWRWSLDLSLSSSSINNIFDSAPIVLLLLALEARSFSQAQKGRRMF
jgi:hypothetical protein